MPAAANLMLGFRACPVLDRWLFGGPPTREFICASREFIPLFDRRREFGAKSILARRVAVERRLLLAGSGIAASE
jgi:hypothetical protein